MEIPIVFEDDNLLVINKPAGVVVNRADTTAEVETVQDWAERKVKSSELSVQSAIDQEFVSRGGIVHRLDKDTSGLLVISKTPAAFENLKNQFKGREVVKKYLALVHGKVEPKAGEINAPIERNPFNRKHFGVFPGGREARTAYRVLKELKAPKELTNETLSLLELTPHTGRTHQIRVHLKYINHPIVSDPIYGGRKNLQADRKFCPRLFLYATYLQIKNPLSGEILEFQSKLPSELQAIIEALSLGSPDI